MRPPPWTWIARLAALGLCSGLTWLLFIDLCDLVFDCGCRSLWAGAAEHCNVHDPSTPDCPWCATGRWGIWAPLAVIFAGQAAALLWPGRLALGWRLLLAIVAFFALGGAVGVGFGLATGYWS